MGGKIGMKSPRPLRGLEWLKAHVNYDGDGCLTWPLSCDSHGYAQVGVGDAKVRKAYQVMCELVRGPRPPGKEATHSCGRGKFGCVDPQHLNWKTRSENQFDSVDHGTHWRAGKATPRYKITAQEAVEIRVLGDYLTQVEIGLIFCISHRNVGKILRGVTWRHLRRYSPTAK